MHRHHMTHSAAGHLGEAQEGVDAVHGLVEHSEEQDGHAGEEDVEGGRADVVHHGLPAVAAVELQQQGRARNYRLAEQALLFPTLLYWLPLYIPPKQSGHACRVLSFDGMYARRAA